MQNRPYNEKNVRLVLRVRASNIATFIFAHTIKNPPIKCWMANWKCCRSCHWPYSNFCELFFFIHFIFILLIIISFFVARWNDAKRASLHAKRLECVCGLKIRTLIHDFLCLYVQNSYKYHCVCCSVLYSYIILQIGNYINT